MQQRVFEREKGFRQEVGLFLFGVNMEYPFVRYQPITICSKSMSDVHRGLVFFSSTSEKKRMVQLAELVKHKFSAIVKK